MVVLVQVIRLNNKPWHDIILLWFAAMCKAGETEVDRVLGSYPRLRIPLSDKNQLIYNKHYKENRSSSGLVNRLRAWQESWMHKTVADAPTTMSEDRILEIGAGNLNHIRWESSYLKYDIVEPKEFLYINEDSKALVDECYSSISELPANNYYTKIVSIACLEHVADLPALISSVKCHLDEGGIFMASVPCEGEALWYLAWRFITGPIYRLKYWSSYSNVMRHEHINSLADVETVLRFYFKNVSTKSYPFDIKNLRLYTTFSCSK